MKKTLLATVLILAAAVMIHAPLAVAEDVKLEGAAYIQGHGGHIAVVDLATGNTGRIVHGKSSDALTLSPDGNTVYVFSLDGFSKQIDMTTGKQTEWQQLGKKHCGSAIAPDGNIWVSDMADGKVYIYDPKNQKLVDSFPVSKSICGISFSKDGKVAYIADMPGGFVNIVDVESKKVTSKISDAGTFLHRHRLNPSGTELWQSDGKELKDGKPAGVGYAEGAAAIGTVSVIDTKSGKVKDTIIIGGNPHDVDFTPDGNYALVVTRQEPERDDSAIVVVDTKTLRTKKVISACKSCHGQLGVNIKADIDGGRPFLCGIDTNWKVKGMPANVDTMGQTAAGTAAKSDAPAKEVKH